MNVKERLKIFIEWLGISVSEFEKVIEASNGYVNNIARSIGVDKIEKMIENYPTLNIDWLMTGRGNMLLSEQKGCSNLNEKRSDLREPIPVYDLTATAGAVSVFSESKESIPMDYISIPNLPNCDGAIHVTGDSMYPLLKSGDMVLYKQVHDKQNIIWGEMYIMYINNSGDEFFFVKYIQQSNREGYIKLVSQNQHHQPVEFPIDSIKQLAIVKASIRINSQI